jgi:hypothetical protein
LQNYTTNLDIPTTFGTSSHGFNGNCLFGLKNIALETHNDNFIYFNIGTLPISGSKIALTNNNSATYNFATTLKVVCYDECTTRTCETCASAFPFCQKCNAFKCLECDPEAYMISNVCQCPYWVVGRHCSAIVGCIQLVTYPDGSLNCVACDPTTYFSTPVGGLCVCLTGTLVNSICSTVLGCIVPQTSPNGTIYCSYCNSSAYFQSTPINGTCTCMASYHLSSGTCV